LRAPFESLRQEEEGLALLESKQVEIVARFGHVATLDFLGRLRDPLRHAIKAPLTRKRRSKALLLLRGLSTPPCARSPPNGLLAASDVLKPLPNATATPFSSLSTSLSILGPAAISSSRARCTKSDSGVPDMGEKNSIPLLSR
jgi:hypothetical protein